MDLMSKVHLVHVIRHYDWWSFLFFLLHQGTQNKRLVVINSEGFSLCIIPEFFAYALFWFLESGGFGRQKTMVSFVNKMILI